MFAYLFTKRLLMDKIVFYVVTANRRKNTVPVFLCRLILFLYAPQNFFTSDRTA